MKPKNKAIELVALFILENNKNFEFNTRFISDFRLTFRKLVDGKEKLLKSPSSLRVLGRDELYV